VIQLKQLRDLTPTINISRSCHFSSANHETHLIQNQTYKKIYNNYALCNIQSCIKSYSKYL